MEKQLSYLTTSLLKKEIRELKKKISEKQLQLKTGDHNFLMIKYPKQLKPGDVVRIFEYPNTVLRCKIASIFKPPQYDGYNIYHILYDNFPKNKSNYVYGSDRFVVEKR